MSRSQFEADVVGAMGFVSIVDALRIAADNLSYSVGKRDASQIFERAGRFLKFLSILADFLTKYDAFFQTLDVTFGWNMGPQVRTLKSMLESSKTSLSQLKVFASEKQYERADGETKHLSEMVAGFYEAASFIASVPTKIDYSRLDADAWKKIGIPGLHYRSRIFLSYPWRNKHPTKDKNESMMNNFIKPLLKMLNIEPVTLRDHSLPQDPIEEKAIRLIQSCDGVIAFYTRRDRLRNVEHEMSQNPNLIAICNEGGSSGPSMRRDKQQIDFDRDDMGVVMMGLMRALKEKGLFRLVV